MREQEANILLLLNSIKYKGMLSFHSGDVRQIARPREREKSNIRTLGRVQTVKSHSLGHECLIKIPPPLPPPPGITLIGALFGYIHYCTEISEINTNLLPNTYSFHRKFWRYISLRMRKMCPLEKLNFKISRGSMPSDPPSVLAPSALDSIFAGLTLKCFRRACYFQSVILTVVLRILRTQKRMFLLSVEKGLLT